MHDVVERHNECYVGYSILFPPPPTTFILNSGLELNFPEGGSSLDEYKLVIQG